MQPAKSKKMASKSIGSIRRKSVGTSEQDLIKIGKLGQGTIPCLIEPAIEGVDLIEWATHNRDRVEELLSEHRALLFRGFNINDVDTFQNFVSATSDGQPLEYRDRSTPRTTKGNRVYTSTVHPADQRINLHNEGTYWNKWALRIYFCCLKAPEQGGATPIADVRRVYDRIDSEIRDRFVAKKMMLVRNYNDGFGLRWQEVFQMDDKDEVEKYCSENNIELEWKDGDRLKTRQVRPAVRIHPTTNEPVWFNHAAFFHYTTLEPTMRDALLGEFGQEGLPYNTCYGDGTPIEPEVAEHLRNAYEQEKIIFPWQEGDVTLLDNMCIAHAREPYVGEREVVVAMTNATGDDELN